MNVIEAGPSLSIDVKISGSNNRKGGVVYSFIESSSNVFIDKQEILLAQLNACERLLKYVNDVKDVIALKKEISELKLTLGLIQY
jgi:hypothetical protein